MKYRRDFVTNSSSSSYVCEVCSRVEESWEGPHDVDMIQCVNGHTFCADHLTDAPLERIHKELLDFAKTKNVEEVFDYAHLDDPFYIDSENEGVPECMCPICSFCEYSEYDMMEFLMRVYDIDPDIVFAEIKSRNKRRKKLYPSEYIEYVCRERGIKSDAVFAQWPERFGSYLAFRKYINKGR